MPSHHARDGALETLLSDRERLGAREAAQHDEIEHLRQAVEELEQSRDHYRHLYHSSPVPCGSLDRHGAVQALNRSASELLQSVGTRFVGVPFVSLIARGDRRRFLNLLMACPPDGDRVSFDCLLTPPSATAVPVRLSLQRGLTSEGGYAIALVDLSKPAITASASRAEESKARFLGLLGRELREPLTPALAALSELCERDDLTGEVRAALTRVEQCVDDHTRLIDDLLDVSSATRLGSLGAEGAVDVHSALRNALDALGASRSRKRIDVNVELTAAQAFVVGDSARLQRAFAKLLENAIEFTPVGGQIAVRTWNKQMSLMVEVSDTGPGIDEGALDHIFEPFRDTAPSASRARGLGTGLATCRAIVELHGGKVVASRSGAGHGARFVLEMPAARVIKRARKRPGPAPPQARQSRALLVAKDLDTAELLELLLRRSGYGVEVAMSTRSALSVAQGAFDVLLSEVALSDGTAIHLLQQMRERGPVCAIAIGGTGPDSARTSKESGFDAHLEKPVNYGELLRVLATLLDHDRERARPGRAGLRMMGALRQRSNRKRPERKFARSGR